MCTTDSAENNSGSPADATYLHYKRKPLFQKKTCMYQQEISQEEFWVKKVMQNMQITRHITCTLQFPIFTAMIHLRLLNEEKGIARYEFGILRFYKVKIIIIYFFSFHGRNRLPRTCKKILKQDNCYIIVEATMNNWVGLDTFIQKGVWVYLFQDLFLLFFRYKQAHIVSLQWD